VNEFAVLEEKYRENYKNEEAYSVDENNKILKWNKNGYEVTVAITPSHGRIYSTIRKPINK